LKVLILTLLGILFQPTQALGLNFNCIYCLYSVEYAKYFVLHFPRCIVISEDMEAILNQHISPTNMYVMLKKKEGRQSEWFIPKDSFTLPFCGRQVIIILSEQVQQQVGNDASCKKTTGSQPCDVPLSNETQQEPMLESENLHVAPKSSQWFQSCVSLKGFKHCSKGV
jgi:hypothetical protein